MLTEPLPNTLDVRKAAARGVSVSGAINPHDLHRFRELLVSEAGSIQAELTLSRDMENRSLVHLAITADVEVTCQRCLSPMSVHLTMDNTLAVVLTDEQANRLPRHLDALITTDEACNLWELVEDELILTLPPFNYHDTEECKESLAAYAPPPPEEADESAKPNPFNVLAQLKPGKKH
jgi:uncharacterized protein